MRAVNETLTDSDRKNLSNAVYETFLEPFHIEYIEKMLASANPDNIKKMFDGFQSIPKPYGGSGFEIQMWDTNGTIETPWFRQPYDENYYKTDKHHHMVLEFPEDLAEQIGSGLLVIEIEVDTRQAEEEGWIEHVEYHEGSRYVIPESKTSNPSYDWDYGESSLHTKVNVLNNGFRRAPK